jgi:hypothetical protein
MCRHCYWERITPHREPDDLRLHALCELGGLTTAPPGPSVEEARPLPLLVWLAGTITGLLSMSPAPHLTIDSDMAITSRKMRQAREA